LARGLAVVHVRRQRGKALGREPVADVLDVPDQPPPFLDDQDARPLSRGRCCEITLGGTAVRSEIDHRAGHRRPPWLGLALNQTEPATGTDVEGAIFTAATRRASASSTVIV